MRRILIFVSAWLLLLSLAAIPISLGMRAIAFGPAHGVLDAV